MSEDTHTAWTIEQDDDGVIVVTDGKLVIAARDYVGALRIMGDLTGVWPEGTGRSPAEHLRALIKRSAFYGFMIGVGWGTLLCVAGIWLSR